MINIFAEDPDWKSVKKIGWQTTNSLQPGHHQNLNMKIKELELKSSRQTEVKTQRGRSVLVPSKYIQR